MSEQRLELFQQQISQEYISQRCAKVFSLVKMLDCCRTTQPTTLYRGSFEFLLPVMKSSCYLRNQLSEATNILFYMPHVKSHGGSANETD